MSRFLAAALVASFALCVVPSEGHADEKERVYVNVVKDHAQFVRFSVPINGSPFTKFVIDAKTEKPYYFWTAVYPFHYHFVNEVLLKMTGKSYGDILEFNEKNHMSEDRDFFLGAISYHPAQRIYTFEFLEGDHPSPRILKRTYAVLKSSFFDKNILWRPIGDHQNAVADKLRKELPSIEAGMLDVKGNYQLLNPGKAVGRLRVVRPGKDVARMNFARDDIVLLSEMPMDIAPVAGIVSLQFVTPLSHVNLRARAWGIPNIGLKDGLVRSRGMEDKWVLLEAGPKGFDLRLAKDSEVAAAKKARTQAKRSVRLPQADLTSKGLPELSELGRNDAPKVGAKVANLGELFNKKTKNYEVPPGFAVPIAHYVEFMKENGLDKALSKLLSNPRVRKDRNARRAALEDLQARIKRGKHLPAFRQALLAKINSGPYKGRGLFVRSSTNAEDLDGFNGAGLYDTVPNVKGDEAMLAAVKQVWASLWNLRAYDERDFYGIDHRECYPGVLLQLGVNATAAGVLITTNIFESKDRATITINAKRGLGMRVVDGKRIPEQVLYNRKTDSIRIISRSDDPIALVFAEDGGVKEVKTEGKPVLSDKLIRELAKAATDVDKLFQDTGAQDIEWLIADDKVQVVQSRPYVQPETESKR